MMATKIDSLLAWYMKYGITIINYLIRSVEPVKVSRKVWFMDELTDLTNEWFKVILHVISIHCRMMATKIDSLLAWYMKYGITIINYLIRSVEPVKVSCKVWLMDELTDLINKLFKVILHVIYIHCRMMATKIDSLLAW